MGDAAGTPLLGPPPKEIPLPHAPLVRVVAQIRFPLLLSIAEGTNLSHFQESIRDEYPFLSRNVARSAEVELGPEGPKIQTVNVVNWRFADDENDWNWRLTLAQDFVSLETKKYESRVDFLERMGRVLKAAEEIYKPKFATRIGIRYVDQLQGDAFPLVRELIDTRVMGIFAHVDTERISRGMSELDLKAEEGRLFLRWGLLPEKVSYDPNILEAIESPSWVLDLDMSSTDLCAFAADELKLALTSFAERVYSMFRWITTDEFLKHYGADI